MIRRWRKSSRALPIRTDPPPVWLVGSCFNNVVKYMDRLVFLKKFGVFLAIGLLLGSLSACVSPKSVPSEPKLVSNPEVERQLLETLRVDGHTFQSLRGLAKVQVVWQGKTTTATQALVVEKPDRFRAETLNPFGFGSPLLLMVTDGSELAVMVPGEGRLFRGEASFRNLQRFTKVPLQLEDLVCLMLYDVPVIAYEKRYSAIDPAGEYRLVLLGEPDRRQELRFNRRMRLLETAYFLSDDLALRVRYDNFSVGSDPFPQSAFMEMPLQKAEASLAFTEIATNVAPLAESFQLTTPPGYEERPIP